MHLLLVGLVLFLGIHLVPAVPPLRAVLASRWGELRYKGAFTLVSAIGLTLVVMAFHRVLFGVAVTRFSV